MTIGETDLLSDWLIQRRHTHETVTHLTTHRARCRATMMLMRATKSLPLNKAALIESSFNIPLDTKEDIPGKLFQPNETNKKLCYCRGTSRRACQYTIIATTKHPILKRLQYTDDLQVDPK